MPLSWSYADESLWRGLSDNKKIIRLARSMITSGYRQDEPINCRTSDLTALDGVLAGKLLFGDGQARGLAARLAFHFLLNTVRTSQDSLMGDPEIMRIMQGLLLIPTVISTGGSTGEDLIIAQAVRQNVKTSPQEDPKEVLKLIEYEVDLMGQECPLSQGFLEHITERRLTTQKHRTISGFVASIEVSPDHPTAAHG